MARIDRNDAHLLIAAVRVLAHREGRSPRPDEVAELLGLPEAAIRLQTAALQEIGAVTLVESAFEQHLEIRDHLAVEELAAGSGPELSADLADFDRRKQEEAEKMARLFDDGTFRDHHEQKLRKMDEDLRAFHRKKPENPFGDD